MQVFFKGYFVFVKNIKADRYNKGPRNFNEKS
jgi:hypothetical protein